MLAKKARPDSQNEKAKGRGQKTEALKVVDSAPMPWASPPASQDDDWWNRQDVEDGIFPKDGALLLNFNAPVQDPNELSLPFADDMNHETTESPSPEKSLPVDPNEIIADDDDKMFPGPLPFVRPIPLPLSSIRVPPPPAPVQLPSPVVTSALVGVIELSQLATDVRVSIQNMAAAKSPSFYQSIKMETHSSNILKGLDDLSADLRRISSETRPPTIPLPSLLDCMTQTRTIEVMGSRLISSYRLVRQLQNVHWSTYWNTLQADVVEQHTLAVLQQTLSDSLATLADQAKTFSPQTKTTFDHCCAKILDLHVQIEPLLARSDGVFTKAFTADFFISLALYMRAILDVRVYLAEIRAWMETTLVPGEAAPIWLAWSLSQLAMKLHNVRSPFPEPLADLNINKCSGCPTFLLPDHTINDFMDQEFLDSAPISEWRLLPDKGPLCVSCILKLRPSLLNNYCYQETAVDPFKVAFEAALKQEPDAFWKIWHRMVPDVVCQVMQNIIELQ